MSGHGRTSSASTCRSAFRRMRSATAARTGAFRPIDGTFSPSAISTGCGTVLGVMRTCTTVTGSITSLVSTGRISVTVTAAGLYTARRAVAAGTRRARAERLQGRRCRDHCRGSGNGSRFRARVAGAAQVPGYKVFRWERQWDEPGQPFRDPASIPGASVATSGTHDTEPMTIWWEKASLEEKRAVLAIPRYASVSLRTSARPSRTPRSPSRPA